MRTSRIIFRTLAKLDFNKILKLIRLFFSGPLFSVLSLVATVRAYIIAKRLFPKTSTGDGVGNAFRHALWSCLIMMYCCKISSPRKAAEWCQKMTDLHEEIFPNPPYQKTMDLHNNRVGLDYFMELLPGVHRQFFETSFFIDALLEKAESAKVLRSLSELPGGELVYLES